MKIIAVLYATFAVAKRKPEKKKRIFFRLSFGNCKSCVYKLYLVPRALFPGFGGGALWTRLYITAMSTKHYSKNLITFSRNLFFREIKIKNKIKRKYRLKVELKKENSELIIQSSVW